MANSRPSKLWKGVIMDSETKNELEYERYGLPSRENQSESEKQRDTIERFA